MAAGRLIVALALIAAVGVLLMGNVRCSTVPPLADPPAPADATPLPSPEPEPAPVAEPGPAPSDADPGTGTGTDTDADADVVPVTIDGRTFRLEVSADGDSRARGLMGRESIEPDGGMLFVFPDVAMRSFWMKNCLTDMDILFLDGSGRVTAIHEMTIEPPQRPDEPEWQYEWRMPGYSSLRPAQFAIELAPRTTRELDIRRGDLIPLDLGDLKRRAR